MSTIKTTTLSTQGGSTVPVDTVVNGTAKAWVNFDGTGISIRRAFNVSSITDQGTGKYAVNFTNALVDDSYIMTHSAGNNGFTTTGRAACRNGDWTTTQCQFTNKSVSNTDTDDAYIGVAIFS